MKTISCPTGLGSRVAAMANALHEFGNIRFLWRNNSHLPAGWQDVFPDGVRGVVFEDAEASEPTTRWGNKLCCQWQVGVKYDDVVNAMAGAPAPERHDVAVLARFHRVPQASVARLVGTVVGTGATRAFVLADSRRTQIRDLLQAGGVDCVIAQSREIDSDLDRKPGDVPAFIGDWKRVLAARSIVTPAFDPTSLVFPALAAGTPLIRSK